MSPFSAPSALTTTSFPRVSGDEPRATDMARAVEEFSPRERG